MIVSSLSSRTTSSYPLSIGTALALESIQTGPNPVYDDARVIPQKVNLDDYEAVWINLLTLFRNICGSVTSDQLSTLTAQDIAEVLAQEVEIIQEVIKTQSHKQQSVVFYSCNYAGLVKEYPHARIRSDTTDRQKHMTELAQATINAFYSDRTASATFKHFALKLKPKLRQKTLILTHYAYDLLSHPQFGRLTLLESHTGLLKDRSLWYTKYHDGKQLMRIPFTELFIQVFGDSMTFQPHDKKLRAAIVEVANQYNWNYATTTDRIKLGLSTLANPYFTKILKEMDR